VTSAHQRFCLGQRETLGTKEVLEHSAVSADKGSDESHIGFGPILLANRSTRALEQIIGDISGDAEARLH
jgi:hypothetical protein